jgi:hypothetical protein
LSSVCGDSTVLVAESHEKRLLKDNDKQGYVIQWVSCRLYILDKIHVAWISPCMDSGIFRGNADRKEVFKSFCRLCGFPVRNGSFGSSVFYILCDARFA